MKHWMPEDIIALRIALADEINNILSATIVRLKEK
jgi:hypothetical protein